LDVRFDGTAAGIEAQVKQVQQIAGSNSPSEAPANSWTSHQAIWDPAEPALVAKFCVLPTQLAAACALVERLAARQSLTWKIVVQSVGAGYVRLQGPEPALRTALPTLFDEFAKLGGTMVALGGSPGVKRGIDVWGPPSDAQPLMVRIKQRFDPEGTLNPGRFVGGI
jgi:glycolate dehydrogenase FAD-binding subunit